MTERNASWAILSRTAKLGDRHPIDSALGALALHTAPGIKERSLGADTIEQLAHSSRRPLHSALHLLWPQLAAGLYRGRLHACLPLAAYTITTPCPPPPLI